MVLVGFGWTGAILGQELTDAGLNVLALERGGWRDTSTDFAVTFAQDELRYMWRHALFQEPARETLTFRNDPSQTALPMRHLGSFLPATGVGGAGIHWNGQTWRFLPSDFLARSHNEQRYGKLPDDMTVQDWGITYDELEPYYDKFEYLCGIGGKAGNLKGPDPARRQSVRGRARARLSQPAARHGLCADAVRSGRQGNRQPPVPVPGRQHVAALHQSARRAARALHLLRLLREIRLRQLFQGQRADHDSAGADAQEEFRAAHRMRGHARSMHDKQAKRATSVIYVDTQGQEFEQPAEIVIMCAYALHNPRLLLLSGIGTPYDPQTGAGRHRQELRLSDHVAASTCSSTTRCINPFIGAGALGIGIDDYNGDNFDHSGLGFIGGGYLACWQTNGRPIEYHPVPKDTPKWGGKWKKAVAKNYLTTGDDLDARLGDEPPRQLSRSRSDLSGRLRPAADAHDVRLHRQRTQDVGLPDRPRRRHRQDDERARDSTPRSAPGTTTSCPTRRRIIPAAPSWAPIRRPAR